MKKGAWTPDEDFRLKKYIEVHGEGNWRTLPSKAGLLRCGKGCRLRWMNYLRPNVKRGHISPDEEEMIIRLHKLLGNRWSLIAGRIPGRTDNEVKNYWNTHLSKRFHTTQIRSAVRNAHKHKKCGDKIPEENDNTRIEEKPWDNATQAVKEQGGSALFGIEEIASILLGTEQVYDTNDLASARWGCWNYPSSSMTMSCEYQPPFISTSYDGNINYSAHFPAQSNNRHSFPSDGNEMSDERGGIKDWVKCGS